MSWCGVVCGCGVWGVVWTVEGTQAKLVHSVMMLCSVYVGFSSPSPVHHHTTPLYSGRILYYYQHQQAEKTAYKI